jgi:hypothetical protein
MNRGLRLIGGMGLGAGLMYFLDPEMGRRRRALLLDQAASLCNQAEDAFRVAGRDLGHRVSGLVSELGGLFAGRQADDRVLRERVRSKMGRVISHPGAVEVNVHNGRVTLSGPVLASEVDALLSCVCSVAGVAGVDNRLEVHQESGNIPALQGGAARTGEGFGLLQTNWSPATRLLAGTAGTALLAYGATRRAPLACVLGSVGLAFMARSLTNKGLTSLFEAGQGQWGVGAQGGPTPADWEKRESGLPGGGQGRKDYTGLTNVYPASGPLPPGDARLQPMATWGQADRGPEGYYDRGDSEIIPADRLAKESPTRGE